MDNTANRIDFLLNFENVQHNQGRCLKKHFLVKKIFLNELSYSEYFLAILPRKNFLFQEHFFEIPGGLLECLCMFLQLIINDP